MMHHALHVLDASGAQLSRTDADSHRLRFPNAHFFAVCDHEFILDPVVSLSDHVNGVSRSCFYYLRQRRLICQSLRLNAVTTLVYALTCGKIDNDNTGLSSTNASIASGHP